MVPWSKLKKNEVEESDCRLESDEDAIKVLTIHKSKGYNFRLLLYRLVGELVVEKGWMMQKKKFGRYMLHLPEPPPGCIFITKNLKGISTNPHLVDASQKI